VQGPQTLVIGCGFIGSNVAIQLAGRGNPPVVLTRSRPADDIVAAIGEASLRVGDAGDPETLEEALAGIRHVAFCAGGLLPVDSEQNPELNRQLTLAPVQAVLGALRKRPDVALTYLSSGGTVYGEPQHLPVSEDDPATPVSSYGKLHLACERSIEQARGDYGLRARILRCATVYGEHQRPDRGQGAIVTFLNRIENDEPIDLYGDGATIRDYIYVGDVARALIGLADQADAPTTINVGSGEGTSLLDLLRLAENQVGKAAKLTRHPERTFDIHQIVLDTTRLHESVELEITPLAAGMARTYDWLSTTTWEAM
jgi:UDP-glucose 4-epimerase